MTDLNDKLSFYTLSLKRNTFQYSIITVTVQTFDIFEDLGTLMNE